MLKSYLIRTTKSNADRIYIYFHYTIVFIRWPNKKRNKNSDWMIVN